MRIENPVAFSFILQDDLYLLKDDKTALSAPGKSEVVASVLPDPVLQTVALTFNYLGSYKKKQLIVVHYPEIEFMADIHFIPLENTLKRLGVGLDDVAILNRAKYTEAAFSDLVDFFNPQKLLILGQKALPTGFDAPKLNQPAQVGQCRTLFTFSFDEMMDNNEYKKAFWEQMKLW